MICGDFVMYRFCIVFERQSIEAVPWLRKNALLARFLQDPCKNAITCKILQGNFLLTCMIFQKNHGTMEV